MVKKWWSELYSYICINYYATITLDIMFTGCVWWQLEYFVKNNDNVPA